MALFKKYDTAAATKTHGEVDGEVLDLINPMIPLDATGNLMRAGVQGLLVWAFTKKSITGSVGIGGF